MLFVLHLGNICGPMFIPFRTVIERWEGKSVWLWYLVQKTKNTDLFPCWPIDVPVGRCPEVALHYTHDTHTDLFVYLPWGHDCVAHCSRTLNWTQVFHIPKLAHFSCFTVSNLCQVGCANEAMSQFVLQWRVFLLREIVSWNQNFVTFHPYANFWQYTEKHLIDKRKSQSFWFLRKIFYIKNKINVFSSDRFLITRKRQLTLVYCR